MVLIWPFTSLCILFLLSLEDLCLPQIISKVWGWRKINWLWRRCNSYLYGLYVQLLSKSLQSTGGFTDDGQRPNRHYWGGVHPHLKTNSTCIEDWSIHKTHYRGEGMQICMIFYHSGYLPVMLCACAIYILSSVSLRLEYKRVQEHLL